MSEPELPPVTTPSTTDGHDTSQQDDSSQHSEPPTIAALDEPELTAARERVARKFAHLADNFIDHWQHRNKKRCLALLDDLHTWRVVLDLMDYVLARRDDLPAPTTIAPDEDQWEAPELPFGPAPVQAVDADRATALEPDDITAARRLIATNHEAATQQLSDAWTSRARNASQQAIRQLHDWQVAHDLVSVASRTLTKAETDEPAETAPPAESAPSPTPTDDSTADSTTAPETTDATDATTEDVEATFRIDSLVLSDCYQTLLEDPSTESVVYLTGVEVAPGEYTLNRMIEVDLAKQGAASAEVDPQDGLERLIALESADHLLLGIAHNHPGSGITNSSSIDDDLHERLEDGGYVTLGLIFTQDGYVRTYTDDLTYEVEVHGDGIERLEDDLLKLDDTAQTVTKELHDT